MSNSEELQSSATAAIQSRSIITTQSANIVHTQLTTRKLKGLENYSQWKNAVTMSLKGRRKSDHLTTEPPAETTPEGVDWHTDDANLVNLLWDCTEPKVSDLVSHCQTVKELWTYLELLYSGKITQVGCMKLLKLSIIVVWVTNLSLIILQNFRSLMKNLMHFCQSLLMLRK